MVVLVFMSPETAISRPWRGLFGESHFKANLIMVAVDEAHCIYEWLILTYNCPVPTYSCPIGHYSIGGESFAEHFQGSVN